jgi:uncharacterized protein (TIGR02266 family)
MSNLPPHENTSSSDRDEDSPASSRSARAPSAAAGRETRRHPRLQVELEVTLQSESNFYLGLTENLSSAGLFIATHMAAPVGTRIDVTFSLPSRSQPIRATGVVRWLREYSETSDGSPGLGVEFQPFDPNDMRSVRDFVKERAPLLFDVEDCDGS